MDAAVQFGPARHFVEHAVYPVRITCGRCVGGHARLERRGVWSVDGRGYPYVQGGVLRQR